MKKIISKPIFWLITIEIIAVIVLALFGFKITYAPALENNWNAISAVAAWAAVIVSIGAIYYAIRVPKKIAEEQNKIALFEKRFASYQALQRYDAFAIQLKEVEDSTYYKQFVVYNFYDNPNATFSVKEAIWRIYEVSAPLHQITYLFDNIPAEGVADMFKYLLDIIAALDKNEEIEELKNKYIQAVDSFTSKYGVSLWRQMQLTKQ